MTLWRIPCRRFQRNYFKIKQELISLRRAGDNQKFHHFIKEEYLKILSRIDSKDRSSIPKVKPLKYYYEVLKGDSVELECTIEGFPKPTDVKWKKIEKKKQVEISIDLKNKYFGSTVNIPSLTILKADHLDSGDYICTVTNIEGTTDSEQIQVSVTDKTPDDHNTMFIVGIFAIIVIIVIANFVPLERAHQVLSVTNHVMIWAKGSYQDVVDQMKQKGGVPDEPADKYLDNGSAQKQNEKQKRILVIGATGSGKSSTGNSILNNKDALKTSVYTLTETKEICETSKCTWKNLDKSDSTLSNITVIDTPSFDNKLTEEQIKKVEKFDAVVLCIPALSITDYYTNVIKFYRDNLGSDDINKKLIIVFTRCDHLENNCDEYLSKKLKMNNIFTGVPDIDKRYVKFDNTLKDTENKLQVEHLLQKITQNA